MQTIKDWALEDRPREKLALKGKEALSDAELVAILIGSGNNEESAVALSRRILAQYKNNLSELGQASLFDLQKFKGIGEAKAITIAAALELGRRRQAEQPFKRPTIRQSSDAFNILSAALSDLAYEAFWVLVLNRANEVLAEVCVSEGGTTATVVDTKRIYQKVLQYDRGVSIILAHNHPSGNLQPSQADIDITQKIKTAGKVLDITVLDHLILAGNHYYSFLDEGRM
jgi:DNA repair protein RadC